MWVLNVLAYQLDGKFMYVGALEDNMQGYVRAFVKAHLLQGDHWMAQTPEEYACMAHDKENDQDKDKEVQVDVQGGGVRLSETSENKTNAEHILKG